MNVPDYDKPLIAWRIWHVNRYGALLSQNDVLWVPRQKLTAGCSSASAHPPLVAPPVTECTCGVYCYRNMESAIRHEPIRPVRGYNSHEILAIGQVYIWGKIIECRNGFRAQYAYPKELVVTNRALASLVKDVYWVPTDILDITELFERTLRNR